MHHYLMLAVGQRDPVIALHDAFAGRHFGTVVIGEVALLGLA